MNPNIQPASSPVSLKSNRLLVSLPAAALAEVERACTRHTYAPDAKIIGQGDNSQDVYFILAGVAHVLIYADTGRVVSFASIGPGEYFGELAAIDGKLRSATVVAASRLDVATMPATRFRGLVERHPKFAMTLLQQMAQIIRRCDDRIFNLSSLKAWQRVCLELLHLAAPDPGGMRRWVVYPMPTQKTLAGNVGTTRETVARVLRSLLTDGVIERKGRSYYIRDRGTLESMALQARDSA